MRTTRADPRHHRKHVHHRHQQQFDDADERSHKDHSNSSPMINGENPSSSQGTPMIDVNLITDLLIQHSQSTGFEKSLEMLTQTLRQLTDPNVSSAISTSIQPSNQISSSNPFESLLMKRLQPSVPPPPAVAPQVWFNSTTPPTYSPSAPPFYSPSGQRSTNPSVDYHPQQQQQHYSNQRN